MTTNQPAPWGTFTAFVLLLAVMWAGTAVLREGPALSSLDFDTDRALETVRGLIPDNRPHPSGSLENSRVADRIEAVFNEYGYAVERQPELFCTDFAPGCTKLENLIAIKSGRQSGGDAVLVTAHYDSVPGAPGAGDDMAGVAALLEIARTLNSEPALLNDVIFLIADAEETGLRGAQAFVEHHPLMQRVRLVINVEARGVAGPSQMFETNVNNAALIDVLAETVSRPVASSLMYEAYRRMPNNTDLTIYKNAGAMGVNFAFSRGVALYHSSRDDLERLSPASLGHHGDNVLHYVRAVGNAGLATLESNADASYVDLFGKWLIHWPAGYNLPAAALALVLILLAAGSQGALRLRAAAATIGLGVLLIVALLVAGWLLSWPLARWPGIHALDHPYPSAGNLALFSAAVLLTMRFAWFAAKRIDRSAYLFANWLFLALLAGVLAGTVAGAAYLLLLPVLAFSLVAIVERMVRGKAFPAVAAWTGVTVSAYMAVYHFVFMDVLTSFYAAWLKMVPLSLTAIAAVALFAANEQRSGRRGISLVAFVVLAAATVAAALVPAYTPDRPRSVNIAYQQVIGPAGSESQSQWRMFTFGPADRAYAGAAGFPENQETFLRWGSREAKAFLADAPDLGLAPPEFTLTTDRVDGGTRTLTGTVRAGRAGFLLGLSFRPGTPVSGLEIGGTPVLTGDNYKTDKGSSVTISGIGDQALDIALTVPADQPAEFVLFELSAFPDDPQGAAIVGKRPDDAASIHFSDHTEIQNHYTF